MENEINHIHLLPGMKLAHLQSAGNNLEFAFLGGFECVSETNLGFESGDRLGAFNGKTSRRYLTQV